MREWLNTFGNWLAVGVVAVCLSFAIETTANYAYHWFGVGGLIVVVVLVGAVLSFRKS